MTDSARKLVGEERLRFLVNDLADQLCLTVDGQFDFTVRVEECDETVEKLQMLINFLLDAARRAVSSLETHNKKLAEIDRMKSEFMANVSHELRTPLTLILGPLESVLGGASGEVPGKMREDLERTQRNALRLYVLVNSLLDFAKLEAGRMQVKWAAVDVGKSLDRLVDDLQPAAQANEIQLRLQLDPAVETVCIDPGMFEKIVLNLIGNALKFTPAGGQVDVGLRAVGNEFELSVADTGMGIAKDQLDRLFERFVQVDSSSTRKHEGTGIGLALVKEFAELMGGQADVASELGKGSRFCVRLPQGVDRLAELSGPEAGPAEEQQLASALSRLAVGSQTIHLAQTVGGDDLASGDSTGKPRVLVAEDNPDMRGYIRDVLAPEFDVRTVENGREALQAARACPPQVIVSDIMMPEMDGVELVREVKQDGELWHTPVILLTAMADQEAVVTSLDSGADDYLSKPFRETELRARVRACHRMHTLYLDLQAKTHELEEKTNGLSSTNERLQSEIEVRKRVEHSLVASEAWKSTILNSTADAMVTISERGTIEMFNPAAEKLFGYAREEVIGRNVSMLTPSPHRENHDGYLERYLQSGEVRVLGRERKVEAMRKDGSRVPVSIRLSEMHCDGKRWFIGMLQDITEREASAARIAQLAKFPDENPNPVLRISNDGKVLYANPASSPWQITVGEPIPRWLKPWLERAVTSGRKVTFEQTVGEFTFDVILAPISESQYVSCFARDITERQVAAAKLAELNEQLVEISRRTGMAEVATGVLHNVGNVLNSVNVSARLTVEKIENSHAGDLVKAVALMDGHADHLADFITSDEQGRHLPGFLRQLSKQLMSERDATLEKLGALVKHVEHINEIVAVQQAYARVSGVMAPIDLSNLVEDALKVNDAGLVRHEVDLQCHFQPLPPITTDRNKVLQILVNLISNAKYALSDSGRSDRRLTIRTAMSGDDRVKIEVEDNGVGISEENLARIFQHGFTTKRNGHGFGLHSSALAAKEVGGTLTAHSDGPGQGAVFTLELPSKVEEALACAN